MKRILFLFYFISVFCFSEEHQTINIPLDVSQVDVQRIDGYYYRYIQYLSSPCLRMELFNVKQKNHKLINYSLSRPDSQLVFCSVGNVSLDDVVDYSFYDLKLRKNEFDFNVRYMTSDSNQQNIKHCVAKVDNQRINPVSCN